MLPSITEASTVAQTLKAMVDFKEFGGEDSTRFIIKNLLAPPGLADSLLDQPLFAWSRRWHDILISGPNCNKWWSVWLDDDTTRIDILKQPSFLSIQE